MRHFAVCLVGRILALVFLLIATLSFCNPTWALASKIKVTKANKNLFAIFTKRAPFLSCYAGTVGEFPSPIILIGDTFTYFNQAQQIAQLTAIEKKVSKLKTNDPQKRTLQKKLLNGKKILVSFQNGARFCGPAQVPTPLPTATPVPKSGGAFSGNAQSLAAYHDALTNEEVTHLLNRVAFGGSATLQKIGTEQGLSALVSALVDNQVDESQPGGVEEMVTTLANFNLYYDNASHPVPIWTTSAVQVGQAYRSIFSANPLAAWMELQESQHFAVALSRSGSYSPYEHYGVRDYWQLIHQNALGNFTTLTKGMLRDRAMNIWLDNKDNHSDSPNQNFARELMELFLLGARDPITHLPNYDEDSVKGATAFVSGFYESEEIINSAEGAVYSVGYDSSLHDAQSYQVFPGTAAVFSGNFMPENFVNHIMYQHPGSPRYIAERLAGKILYPGLSDNIVSELAATLKNNNFELKPFLKKILSSEAMFSNSARASCISSPLEASIRLARRIIPNRSLVASRSVQEISDLMNSITYNAGTAGQWLFDPPSVFGWKGACNINRDGQIAKGEGWLSGQRTVSRHNSCIDMVNHLNWQEYDWLSALAIPANVDAPTLASNIAENALGVTVTDAAIAKIATYLTTDTDWDSTVPYSVPVTLSDPYYVRRKIPGTICALFDLPSFQTS